MVHAVLSGPLHAPILRRTLEVLVTKGTNLVSWSAKITLSIAAAEIVVAIATTGFTTVTTTTPTILGLTATKGTFWPTTKASIIVPVPVATTEVAPPSPRIPITTVILVATSSPPSTTWTRGRKTKNTLNLYSTGEFDENEASVKDELCDFHQLKGWTL